MVKLVFFTNLWLAKEGETYGKHIPKIWQHFGIPLGLTPFPGCKSWQLKV